MRKSQPCFSPMSNFTQTDLERKAYKTLEYIMENHSTSYDDQFRIIEIMLAKLRITKQQHQNILKWMTSDSKEPLEVLDEFLQYYGGK